ncbi:MULTISPECIES: hypothetical protein [Streptomyces]|nr:MULTISPECIES: hypothetical protein [Streptomyces]
MRRRHEVWLAPEPTADQLALPAVQVSAAESPSQVAATWLRASSAS